MNNTIQITYTNSKGEVTTLKADENSDIFLSHSKLKREIKLGMRKNLIEGLKTAMEEIKPSEDDSTIIAKMFESICALSIMKFKM